jgi:hypothetical protein
VLGVISELFLQEIARDGVLVLVRLGETYPRLGIRIAEQSPDAQFSEIAARTISNP